MSLAQKIFRIFLYLFIAQIILIGLWASSQLFFSKKVYPEKIVNNLINVDKAILEAAILQNKMKSYGARDLLIYRLLETNSVDSVEYVNASNLSEIISMLKLDECSKAQSATICTRANGHYLTSLIPLEFDGITEGYLKLEKSLRGYDETNKKVLISIGLTALIIFIINLLTILMVWSRFLKPETLKLLNAISKETKDNNIQIKEFQLIQDKFLTVLSKAKIAEAEKSKLEIKSGLISLATQVAHDIRSPLEVMKVIKDDLTSLPDKPRRLLTSSIQRIEEIAYNLLRTQRDLGKQSEEKIEEINLLKLILNIVTEKRIEYNEMTQIELKHDISDKSYTLHSKFNRSSLQRIISNIINNAIQSLPQQRGKILIKLESVQGKNVISVTDTGQGIPSHVQENLFAKGFTTKDEGNGLGLHHAKNELEKNGGSISYKTAEGKGTTFFITLPDTGKPPLFPSSINLFSHKKVIILDDDPSIHEGWRKRFDEIGISTEHFLSSLEMLSKYESLPPDVILLSDFDLQEEGMDGINCIQKLGHQSHSILITARDEEEEIFKRCFKEGILLLSKELMNYIPISLPLSSNLSNPEIVLIDDDRFVHINWKNFCSKNNFQLKSFFTIESFLEESSDIKKDALIYVDSSLGNGLSGELEAQKFFDMGYMNIFMATGYNKEHFSKYPWIKDVISKSPEGMIEHIKEY